MKDKGGVIQVLWRRKRECRLRGSDALQSHAAWHTGDWRSEMLEVPKTCPSLISKPTYATLQLFRAP
jgi:hypothetical protein